jgi:hypothetical protein
MATTSVNLYKSLHKREWPDSKDLIVDDVPAIGILYPTFEEKDLGDGRKRAPDVDFAPPESGIVKVMSGGGTSLWDREGVLGGAFRNFTIPQGTVIPEPLKVEKGRFDKRRQATHHQIEVATGSLEIGAFKGALDNLARAAVVRAIELAKGVAKKSTSVP